MTSALKIKCNNNINKNMILYMLASGEYKKSEKQDEYIFNINGNDVDAKIWYENCEEESYF